MTTNIYQVEKYVTFLKSEIAAEEENLNILAELIETGPPQLDPNWRLKQGYLHCLIKVFKDLLGIIGGNVPDDFYPDMDGLLMDEELTMNSRHSEGQESLRQSLLEQKADEEPGSCWKCGDGEIDKAFDYRCSYCEEYLCVGCETEFGDCPCQYFAMTKKGEEAVDD
jgi:hypothetical protein